MATEWTCSHRSEAKYRVSSRALNPTGTLSRHSLRPSARYGVVLGTDPSSDALTSARPSGPRHERAIVSRLVDDWPVTERSLAEWRDQYRDELVEIDATRLAEDEDARRHNRHVDRMQEAYLALRQTAEGRAVISGLIDDPVPTVALWAATQALFWDEPRARARLTSFVDGQDLHAFEAEVTLRRFDGGRLKTDWQPNRV